MRRTLGAVLVTWASYRILKDLAAHPDVADSFERLAARWWPALLIVAALFGGARALSSAPMLRGPALLGLIGGFGLLITSDVLNRPSPWALAVPLAIMVAGLLLLTAGRPHRAPTHTGAYPAFRAVCAVRRLVCTSKPLIHSRALVVLGGLRVDFCGATTARMKGLSWSEDRNGHGAVLDVTAIGGTVEVVVPPTWCVEIRQAPFSRPVRADVPRDVPLDRLTGRLQLNVLTAGGDVEVRT